MKEEQIVITLDDGTESVANILFTHFSEQTKKNYVVFEFIDNGEISAAIYEPNADEEGQGLFSDIETEAEWDLMDELLDSYFSDLEEAEEEEEDLEA